MYDVYNIHFSHSHRKMSLDNMSDIEYIRKMQNYINLNIKDNVYYTHNIILKGYSRPRRNSRLRAAKTMGFWGKALYFVFKGYII